MLVEDRLVAQADMGQQAPAQPVVNHIGRFVFIEKRLQEVVIDRTDRRFDQRPQRDNRELAKTVDVNLVV